MFTIYSACLSVSAIDGKKVTLSIHSSHTKGDDTRRDDYQMTLDVVQAPEDLRDWLRQALAMAVEAI